MKKLPGTFHKNARHKRIGWLLATLVFFAGISPPVQAFRAVPRQLTLTEGYQTEVRFPWPVTIDLRADTAVLMSSDESLSGQSFQLTPLRTGLARMTVNLLGLIPVRTMNVNVRPEKIVVPGGHSIGVMIKMRGVLVVGASDLSGAVPSPARISGLRAGDSIETVDGVPVENAIHLSRLISSGNTARLGVRRDGKLHDVPVTPLYDARDGAYRLGVWVRDSTAGIGTLSFYDPESGGFGALGHAISDIDTGSILQVAEGEIIGSTITDVRKGESGVPGELTGEFSRSADVLGEITVNGVQGIYGYAYAPILNEYFPDGVPIMRNDEVRLGPAKLYTTLDEEGIKPYDCEIVKLNEQSAPAQRSMVVKITDEELLEKTGGIVQGMSGSPIIQDGRMAGAITHVYVNDPTQGFGVYIEWMLEQLRGDQAA